MAKDIEADWVVIDASKQVMRCDRCGETESLSIITGKRIELAVGYMNVFTEVHEKCLQRVHCLNPDCTETYPFRKSKRYCSDVCRATHHRNYKNGKR